jgi:glycosyltransferase involved in cell wall biosynthesis
LRIVQIIPTLDRGGAEKQMTLLACAMARLGFEVEVVVLTRTGPLEDLLRRANVPIHFINKRFKFDPFAYFRLKRKLRELKPDVVHTWIFAANAYGRLAAIRTRVPVVIAGERCVDQWKSKHELLIDRWLTKRTQLIATNSTGVCDFYEKNGIPPDRFVVIPNGVDASDVQAIDEAEFLKRTGLPPGTRRVVAVGRLWPQKRYKDLIWAVELLDAARGGDTHLCIVGDGPQRDQLEFYRDKVELAHRVHFLGHREDVAQLLPHFDCFWIGSGYEGQSNGLMEAMQSGVPAVASDIPGNRDLITHDVHGFLFPVGDRAELASCTHRILDNEQLSHRLAQAAKQRMLEEFTVEQMVDRYIQIYRNAFSVAVSRADSANDSTSD